MAGPTSADDLHRSSIVVDLHVHGPDFVPAPFRWAYKASSPRRPRDDRFDAFAAAGVDAAVATAVGDPIVTRWYLRRSPAEAVEEQLRLIEVEAAAHGVDVVTTAAAIDAAARTGRPAVVLGVEGGDALGEGADAVERVDAWYARGVRLVVPVHLADNQLGTTCLPWQQYAGPLPVRRRAAPGLSALGRAVVRRMQEVGILVDLSHADVETLRDVVDLAEAPVVSSHAGARAVQDFARYHDDEQLRMLASTGGLIGLWPYRSLGKGVRDLAELVAHARHVADVIGPEHLCLGTDMNGVPGVMAGYRGERDVPTLTAALLDGGFAPDEVRGIMGANALRVLRAIER